MPSLETTILVAGVGATLELFRLAIDLIATASQKDAVATQMVEKATAAELRASLHRRQSLRQSLYRSSMRLLGKNTNDDSMNETTHTATKHDEDDDKNAAVHTNNEHSDASTSQLSKRQQWMIYVSAATQFLIMVYFLVVLAILESDDQDTTLYSVGPSACTAAALFVSLLVAGRDRERIRFSKAQRFMHALSAIILLLGIVFCIALTDETPSTYDIVSTVLLILHAGLVFLECHTFSRRPTHNRSDDKKEKLSLASILIVLKPYFWPDATATSATLNRIRAISTWIFVGASKACGLLAPIYIGRASTNLAQAEYHQSILNVIWFSLLTLASHVLKEAQSLVYLRVAQVAFVQLAELSFGHLHSLSLDWHLKKKLGEVLRMMTRGIAACDTLVKYLFLWLIPAVAECILVAVIFALYFDELALAVTVFFFVFAYMVLTVLLTLWRKKFRKQVAKSDNDWNDVATDSLINFETVKYFTAETFEKDRFAQAVEAYQKGNVNVAASLSTLNISQKILLQSCLAVSLAIVVLSIQDRYDCCEDRGCDFADADCCNATPCSGMEIGDFVAVLQYTLNLFTPLNFLGSVYNAIVMAIVDLANLSELLAESADVDDADDAIPVPSHNNSDPDTVVEFDNVRFHYPSQPETSGLKGVSFQMKKGTTTAVVGSTGAGKTTISRLLFRFYDVTGGAVKVNGVDVRTLKQASLRGMIGVVPQATTLFNDSLGSNIKYGKMEATEEEVAEAVEAAQLTNFVESLPDGLETMVGDRGLKLSGGEKQRTAIARCILKNPPICIFDEATSALDTITEQSIKEALDRLGSDRTVLVIAHRLGTIKNADQIIVLKDGLINEKGTHEELLALGGQYADMWNMQLNSTKTSNTSLAELTA